ncbi:MAG TPA: acetyl-CoA carboxylase biotin carboxyl carrier protein [Phaeodactylibacter sp.]|nr:acetyl-CoA carboxylase biotin carboxyl carrier protein [Phaeodactylibacter sp.]
MTFKEVQELIKLINKSNLTEFKLKKADFSLSIRTKKYGKGKFQNPPPQIVSVPAPPQVPVHMSPPAATPAPSAQPTQENIQPDASKQNAEDNANLLEIKSPIVGTFYRASGPDKDPFVKVGDVVEVGDVVCIVEAMKLFNEIESEVSGRIVKVLIEDSKPVQYDQPLFLVDPKG